MTMSSGARILRLTRFASFASLKSNNHPFLSQLIVQDVTPQLLGSTGPNHGRGYIGFRKIVLGDFSHPKVALLAKRCTRMATCVIDMFPDSPMFAWDMFSAEIKCMHSDGSGNSYIDGLAQMSGDADRRDDLLRFVRGCSEPDLLAESYSR